MEAASNLSDALLAAGMVAIFFCTTIWCLYRVVTWARRRSKRAYVIGAALAPLIALGRKEARHVIVNHISIRMHRSRATRQASPNDGASSEIVANAPSGRA